MARTLALTPMGSRVAVWLAEGKTVRDMAEATGRTQGSIYWHLKQLYRKQPISRQVDLVRLVLFNHRVRARRNRAPNGLTFFRPA